MIVIKMGGTTGVNIDAVMSDVAAQVQVGRRLIVVHGGSLAARREGRRAFRSRFAERWIVRTS